MGGSSSVGKCSVRWQQAPQRTRGAVESLDPTEAAETMRGGEMWFEGQEAVVSVAAQLPDHLRPAGDSLARGHHLASIGDVLDVDVREPATERVVGIGIRTLAALDEVGSVERDAEMGLVDGRQKVDAAA